MPKKTIQNSQFNLLPQTSVLKTKYSVSMWIVQVGHLKNGRYTLLIYQDGKAESHQVIISK